MAWDVIPIRALAREHAVNRVPRCRGVRVNVAPGPVDDRKPRIEWAREWHHVLVRGVRRAVLTTVSAGGAYLVLGRALRPWYSRWGATDEETRRALPGDELVPTARAQSTWAVSIATPAERVWPWLVQMGQDRAGFYTYEWFENRMLRLDIHNADRVVPEWQHLRVGDRLWFYPERYPIKPRGGPRVVAIEPNRALLLCHQVTDDADSCPGTWQFVLEPAGDRSTRLLLRARSGPGPTTWFDTLAEPVYFLMTRGMLLGIKRRAETGSS
jgi:hypothetical protein